MWGESSSGTKDKNRTIGTRKRNCKKIRIGGYVDGKDFNSDSTTFVF